MLSGSELYRCMYISIINKSESTIVEKIERTVKTSSTLTHADDMDIHQYAKYLTRLKAIIVKIEACRSLPERK